MSLSNFIGYLAGIEHLYANGAAIVGTANNDTLDFRRQNSGAPSLFVTLYNVATKPASAYVQIFNT